MSKAKKTVDYVYLKNNEGVPMYYDQSTGTKITNKRVVKLPAQFVAASVNLREAKRYGHIVDATEAEYDECMESLTKEETQIVEAEELHNYNWVTKATPAEVEAAAEVKAEETDLDDMTKPQLVAYIKKSTKLSAMPKDWEKLTSDDIIEAFEKISS